MQVIRQAEAGGPQKAVPVGVAQQADACQIDVADLQVPSRGQPQQRAGLVIIDRLDLPVLLHRGFRDHFPLGQNGVQLVEDRPAALVQLIGGYAPDLYQERLAVGTEKAKLQGKGLPGFRRGADGAGHPKQVVGMDVFPNQKALRRLTGNTQQLRQGIGRPQGGEGRVGGIGGRAVGGVSEKGPEVLWVLKQVRHGVLLPGCPRQRWGMAASIVPHRRAGCNAAEKTLPAGRAGGQSSVGLLGDGAIPLLFQVKFFRPALSIYQGLAQMRQTLLCIGHSVEQQDILFGDCLHMGLNPF